MPELPSFKDFSFTFKSHPITNDLQVVKDENAIKQSVRSLLLTSKGERLFNADIGTRLKEILFEPLDFASASIIETEIAEILARYEPRISVVNLDAVPNELEDGYDVDLEYSIVGQNKLYNAEYFLDRNNI